MSSNQAHPCAVCAQPTTLKCSRCKAVYYCSKDHIRSVSFSLLTSTITPSHPVFAQDWPSHKRSCHKPTTDSLTVTAVLFPADGGNPRLVDVAYQTYEDEDDLPGVMHHRLNLDPWFPNRKGYPIHNHGYHGPPLGRTLMMFFNDMFLIDGSPLNQCIAHLVSNGHPWGGNVLVVRAREPLSTVEQYYNATMDDVEPTVAYLRDYGAAVSPISSPPLLYSTYIQYQAQRYDER